MTPRTEAELAEYIAAAQSPLLIKGGATRGVVVEGDPLETGGLTGISLYDPGALTLVVQAGTTLDEISAALNAEGQRLAFEPVDYRGVLGTTGQPTIGGVVATNASGPQRVSVGACRDFMLGVRVVDGTGQVIKNGGRVMKNVTGYDLVKLLTGSWGTLGVLTEVSLKVLPKPEAAASIEICGLDNREAIAAMARALRSPFEVSGAAHLPDGPDSRSVTYLRIEGFAGSVDYRAGQIASLFGGMDVHIEKNPDTVARSWAGLRDVGPFHGQDGDIWRVSCKPSDAPDLIQRAAPDAHFFDWGGGLIWLRMPNGAPLRERLGQYDGHATVLRGAGHRRFEPDPPEIAALSAGLRRKFDPRGILNTGLMG